MKRKVYVVGTYIGYASSIYNRELVDDIDQADIVLLTGGADVDPSTYGKPAIPETYGYKSRDMYEVAEYKKVRKDQLVIGICRGAQLLTVLNGGNLIQHVTNHAGGMHKMIDEMGNIFPITSLHHQMCYPYDMPREDYEILFKAFPARSTIYKGIDIDVDKIVAKGEPEVIVFHKETEPVALAIQGHPEMMDKDCKTVELFNELIDKYLKLAKNRSE